MNRQVTPASLAPPAANYALAVVSEDARRWLHTSGIVPICFDGIISTEISEQADVVWKNLLTILTEAAMHVDDVVSITTYVVADHLAALPQVMASRDQALGGRRVASTLVTVPALARPEWKLEIALVAAR